MFLPCVALAMLIPASWGFPSIPGDSEKVLLVLVDGVRWDYINDSSVYAGFKRIEDNGVKAEYVTPVFPSNSYPNWYTIVTGLYPEKHGIVQNYMYDPEYDDLFLMALHSNASHSHWWNDAEPVWVTAEKRDLKTAVYWWDGCQVMIRGRKSTKCEEYANYWVWGKVNRDTLNAMNEVLDKFQKDSYRLGLVYYEAVDANGHLKGPDSEDRVNSLKDIDSILNSIQDQIARRGMEHQVNLIVVSDHGMKAIDPKESKVINIEKFIDIKDVKIMLDRGAVSMILPAPGKLDKLYNDLKSANIEGLTVYKKNEIPEHYHFRNHRLVQPILLIADEGYVIKAVLYAINRKYSSHIKALIDDCSFGLISRHQTDLSALVDLAGKNSLQLSDPKRMKPFAERIFKGYHGYDPYKVKDMRTIFYARGPSFKQGFLSPPLEMVDHYGAICRAMGMEPLPNNGSWPRTQRILTGNALRPETHIGPDKKSKVVLLSKSKSIKKNKSVIFKGKRKNASAGSVTISDWQLIVTLILSTAFLSRTRSLTFRTSSA